MKILVTGATGHLGSLVVKTLLDRVSAEQIAVSVRDPQKAAALAERGVDVRHGDFEDPASLAQAFAGIDRLLIVSTDGDTETRIRQHANAVEAARNAGVGFIAYTSAPNAQESELFLAEVHRETENAIRATGIPYAFLRNNWYIENEAGAIQGIVAGAPLVTSAGDGKVGWAARGDYAEAAAAVLAGAGHENKVYELGGPLRTYAELAGAVSEALGREVPFQQVDDDTYVGIMKSAGVPEFALPIVTAIQQAIRAGTLAVESGDLEKLLGRPATPLTKAVAEIAGVQ
ncbi:NAD(P)H dehydrogenase (quinone) [Cohnella sp. OV330]|uniref:SDR family oxidoreductase n=1 Tax=Cohnella sp. OV330 TaxID=1855288 RepID=UPI0008EFD204|nr:SDR family oxidoreductase [Cohnella sp. OV330]SFB56165.1 NAD(P)H dehydrogenase (quinone) [Cohnella sp. OV330]